MNARVVDKPLAAGRAAITACLGAWLRLDARGAEQVPDAGGVLVAATHTSHADSLALAAAVRHRHLLFLGASYLADTPIVGPLLPRLGLLPIERGTANPDLLDELATHLRSGRALAVYPEGSRSRTGHVHRPKSGVARLAVDTGVPVVPVGITGTAQAWPVDQRPRLRPIDTAVRLRVGAPLPPPEPGARSRREWTEQLHTVLADLAERPAADCFAPTGGATAAAGAGTASQTTEHTP